MANKSPQETLERVQPRFILVTAPAQDNDALAKDLPRALAAADVAAVILRLPPLEENALSARIKALAPLVQKHDAAFLVEAHAHLAGRGGADGAHLISYEQLDDVFDLLKPDRIAGCGGLHTRHDAMMAAERGTDYVMFGEPDANGERPAFGAIEERVAWWAQVFQTPCAGYAASVEETAAIAATGAEFVALDPAVWADPDALKEAAARLMTEPVE